MNNKLMKILIKSFKEKKMLINQLKKSVFFQICSKTIKVKFIQRIKMIINNNLKSHHKTMFSLKNNLKYLSRSNPTQKTYQKPKIYQIPKTNNKKKSNPGMKISLKNKYLKIKNNLRPQHNQRAKIKKTKKKIRKKQNRVKKRSLTLKK